MHHIHVHVPVYLYGSGVDLHLVEGVVTSFQINRVESPRHEGTTIHKPVLDLWREDRREERMKGEKKGKRGREGEREGGGDSHGSLPGQC